MKVLFIGDIHGHDTWKELVNKALTNFYEIVFLGDYVDSFSIKPVDIAFNLIEIINFKIKHPDKVTLLLGNHDYAYINDYMCTGFDATIADSYKKIFQDNHKLFDIAWGYLGINGKYTLATHAGLTKGYYDYSIKPILDYPGNKLNKIIEGINNIEIHQILNILKDDHKVLWKIGRRRGGSSHPSPLWADYQELLVDRYKGINQVFGHTTTGTLTVSVEYTDLIVKVDDSMAQHTMHILLDL